MTRKNKIVGKRGEDAAAEYLEKRGMKILARNYRIRDAEIDVVADDGDAIVFAEVKARTGTAYGRPAEAVNFRKQNKIIKAAGNGAEKINHIQNAFEVA